MAATGSQAHSGFCLSVLLASPLSPHSWTATAMWLCVEAVATADVSARQNSHASDACCRALLVIPFCLCHHHTWVDRAAENALRALTHGKHRLLVSIVAARARMLSIPYHKPCSVVLARAWCWTAQHHQDPLASERQAICVRSPTLAQSCVSHHAHPFRGSVGGDPRCCHPQQNATHSSDFFLAALPR